MKKNFFFVLTAIAVFFTLSTINAQNTSPYWSLAGNSNATASSKLGTSKNIPLRLFTNNAERLRIDPSGKVGIGTASPNYKLQVDGGAETAVYATSSGNVGVYGSSSYIGVYGAGGSYGLYGYDNSRTGYGVYGYGGIYGVYGSSYNSGYGLYGVSTSSFSSNGCSGVYGSAYYGVKGNGTYGVYGTGTDYGVYGNSTYSYGVYGYSGSSYGVTGNSGFVGVYGYGGTYGVYAYAANSGGYAGYFNGNIFATGSYYGSDIKLKQNISDVTSGLDIINKLQPKSYEYKQDGNYKLMNLPRGRHYGLIAQDLEQVLPDLVKETKFDTRLTQQSQNQTQAR